MAMSALYYPHSSIQSENVLKTSLLLWDTITLIVPWDDFRSQTERPKEWDQAFELIGRKHVPTRNEKVAAHDLIMEFATRPRLPASFTYEVNSSNLFEIYPQKFLDETWWELERLRLAGDLLPNMDRPTTVGLGLTQMSILADCCAGETLTRITDQGSAYATIADLLTEEPKEGLEKTPCKADDLQLLISASLKSIGLDAVPLKNLIDFRVREETESNGHHYRALRHNYKQFLERQVSAMSGAIGDLQRKEALRAVEQSFNDDLAAIRTELRVARNQVLLSKEMLCSFLGAAGTVAFVAGNPLASLLTAAGGATGAFTMTGGLVASSQKYVAARQGTLEKHPLAYLYEMAPGSFIRP